MEIERFNKVLDRNAKNSLTLNLTPGQVTMLYGAIVFVGAHHELRQDLMPLYWDRLDVIRKNIEKILGEMGFTAEEIRWLATRGSRLGLKQ